MLKEYNDPRQTDEPLALKSFNKNNKSKILTAPQLYDYKIISKHQGWLIMEKLPALGKFFKPPLTPQKRKEFLKIFLEYKKYFPQRPHRKLHPYEKLSADKFNLKKLNHWLKLSKIKSIKNYQASLNLINKEFSKRKMQWVHGHFKPQEIYYTPKLKKYYLTDFAHVKKYPEGYELAFIIWADQLMTDPKNHRGVYTWIKELKPIAHKLKIKNFDSLIKASLVERILGTIIADIGATNKSQTQKDKLAKPLYQLLEKLLAE